MAQAGQETALDSAPPMALDSVTDGGGSGAGRKERLYTSPLLIFLLLAYATNQMDRTIVSTLAQAIKADLKISDGQIGLLQGFAFAILYSVAGIPIARATHRYNRINIVSICMTIWSGMTMLCGFTSSFMQLLVFRVFVGVGEAGCNAPSHSMIADAFEPEQRSRAIGIYFLGLPLGIMLGAIIGGFVAQHVNWRYAFIMVGAPGVVLAIMMRLTIREPQRKAVSLQVTGGTTTSQITRRLATEPALRNLVSGFVLATFTLTGANAFTQAYFIRAFGLSYSEIGLLFGLVGGLTIGCTLLLSGWLADAAAKRDVRWDCWLPAIGSVMAVPFYLGMVWLPSWPLAFASGMAASFFMNWFIAPSQGAIHKIIGRRNVAVAMAVILLVQNLVASGGGPLFVGMMGDYLGDRLFAGSGLGAFSSACPGGSAPEGAATDLVTLCHDTLVTATRWSLALTTLFALWASVHFLLAARHIRKALAAAV